jgi:dynein-related subfamily AAA family protein
MLIGPTATGKTTQAKEAAFQLDMGFELVVLDEGWDAQELFGGYTRSGKDWAFTPGPITRWAERVSKGETVMLIVDELARGHRSVVSAIMRVMSEHSAADLRKMGITVPTGEDGPFYIVDVTATEQRIPVPCRKARIIATGTIRATATPASTCTTRRFAGAGPAAGCSSRATRRKWCETSSATAWGCRTARC